MWLRQLAVCLISSPWHLLKLWATFSQAHKQTHAGLHSRAVWDTGHTLGQQCCGCYNPKPLLFLCIYTSNSLGAGLKALVPYSLV